MKTFFQPETSRAETEKAPETVKGSEGERPDQVRKARADDIFRRAFLGLEEREQSPKLPEAGPTEEARKERADDIFRRTFAVQEETPGPTPPIVRLPEENRLPAEDPGEPCASDRARPGSRPEPAPSPDQDGASNEADTPRRRTEVRDGRVYSYDDNGNLYMVDGKLEPDAAYEINGAKYRTDEKGRIISCEARPRITPENERDTTAQTEAGGKDRRAGDQGGHILGRELGGDGGKGNLVPMDSRINQSDYKRMENAVRNALNEGRDVSVKTEISYSGDSERPDRMVITVTADGKDTVYTFDNNLDGSLMDKVNEIGGAGEAGNVEKAKDRTGGEVSSVKEVYDENGNLVRAEALVTYTDENGENHRVPAVIYSGQGGEAA